MRRRTSPHQSAYWLGQVGRTGPKRGQVGAWRPTWIELGLATVSQELYPIYNLYNPKYRTKYLRVFHVSGRKMVSNHLATGMNGVGQSFCIWGRGGQTLPNIHAYPRFKMTKPLRAHTMGPDICHLVTCPSTYEFQSSLVWKNPIQVQIQVLNHALIFLVISSSLCHGKTGL